MGTFVDILLNILAILAIIVLGSFVVVFVSELILKLLGGSGSKKSDEKPEKTVVSGDDIVVFSNRENPSNSLFNDEPKAKEIIDGDEIQEIDYEKAVQEQQMLEKRNTTNRQVASRDRSPAPMQAPKKVETTPDTEEAFWDSDDDEEFTGILDSVIAEAKKSNGEAKVRKEDTANFVAPTASAKNSEVDEATKKELEELRLLKEQHKQELDEIRQLKNEIANEKEKEKELRELEAKEKELKAQQAKEQAEKEKEIREQELKEKERLAIEKAEKETRERLEQEAREREEQERLAREQERLEREELEKQKALEREEATKKELEELQILKEQQQAELEEFRLLKEDFAREKEEQLALYKENLDKTKEEEIEKIRREAIAEQEKLEAMRIELEKEQERLAEERAEQERLAKEREEQERLASETTVTEEVEPSETVDENETTTETVVAPEPIIKETIIRDEEELNRLKYKNLVRMNNRLTRIIKNTERLSTQKAKELAKAKAQREKMLEQERLERMKEQERRIEAEAQERLARERENLLREQELARAEEQKRIEEEKLAKKQAEIEKRNEISRKLNEASKRAGKYKLDSKIVKINKIAEVEQPVEERVIEEHISTTTSTSVIGREKAPMKATVKPTFEKEYYEHKILELEEELRDAEKELRANKTEYIPLTRIHKAYARDGEKLRKKEMQVAKQKVALYGVRSSKVDPEKKAKLDENLQTLAELKDSVAHCEEVIRKNKDRYPVLEKNYNLLNKQILRINDDIKVCNKAIEYYNKRK